MLKPAHEAYDIREDLTPIIEELLAHDKPALKVILSGGKLYHEYEAIDDTGNLPALVIALTVEPKEPKNYFDTEEDEIEEEALDILNRLRERNEKHNCGGCRKCRK